jgi:antitoxin component of RelBE/YafQ-DinJ toxin-antitoxin module
MDYLVSVRLPETLSDQAERAAASLGLSADEYLRIALQEKVSRWVADEEHKEFMDTAMKHVMEKNQTLFRRLAEWPESTSTAGQDQEREGE